MPTKKPFGGPQTPHTYAYDFSHVGDPAHAWEVVVENYESEKAKEEPFEQQKERMRRYLSKTSEEALDYAKATNDTKALDFIDRGLHPVNELMISAYHTCKSDDEEMMMLYLFMTQEESEFFAQYVKDEESLGFIEAGEHPADGFMVKIYEANQYNKRIKRKLYNMLSPQEAEAFAQKVKDEEALAFIEKGLHPADGLAGSVYDDCETLNEARELAFEIGDQVALELIKGGNHPKKGVMNPSTE